MSLAKTQTTRLVLGDGWLNLFFDNPLVSMRAHSVTDPDGDIHSAGWDVEITEVRPAAVRMTEIHDTVTALAKRGDKQLTNGEVPSLALLFDRNKLTGCVIIGLDFGYRKRGDSDITIRLRARNRVLQ